MTFKPNADCFRVGKKFFIYKLNEFWELIYYHDYSTAGVWKDEEEALYSKKADKYSILSLIDSRYKTNDEYEFLLEYPGYSGYNRWCQKLNPLEENEVNGKCGQTAEGFRGQLLWRPC